MKKSKRTEKTVWLGEVEIIGYPLVCIAETSEECRRLLLAAHRKEHEKAKTSIYARDWDHLEELTEVSVRMVMMNTVVWP